MLGDFGVMFPRSQLQSKLLSDHIRGCARWQLVRHVACVCLLVYIHATEVHAARVLRLRVTAVRDVQRVYTYEINAQRVGTGSHQHIYVSKVLNGF